MPKRKASPEKVTTEKRMRVAELPEPTADSSKLVSKLKRKAEDDGAGPSSSAKKVTFLGHLQSDEEAASSSSDTSKESSDEKEKVCRRKAVGDEKASTTNTKNSPDQEETNSSRKKSVAEQRREFEAKYVQEDKLGAGGCGIVFAGYRKIDHFPVAIKHIRKDKVLCKITDEDGKRLPVEVAAMLKFAGGGAGSVGTSAAVPLLEWFDLRTKLILVMERPVPAMDLRDYIEENEGSLTEEMAKVIVKQLIVAAKDLEDKNIFHRDIKTENILIETGSDVPRVRLIDFGVSCFCKKRSRYHTFSGTPNYSPPEYLTTHCYRSGPTTVWQLGAVLYEVLHDRTYFDTIMVLRKNLQISTDLSTDCQNFLEACLKIVPEKRPTLEDLLAHPWLS